VLILWLGYVGAAWAVLLGDSIHLTLCWMMLQKSGGAPSLTKAFVAPGIAAATTLAASALLSGLGAGQRLIAVSIVLGAGMWIFGAVRLHDLRFLRALIFGAESLPRA
jgi:peptidoglycan biosynthesis protein MviN/MurJ (putative lipid II flippase)